jgi:hypothetical protein
MVWKQLLQLACLSLFTVHIIRNRQNQILRDPGKNVSKIIRLCGYKLIVIVVGKKLQLSSFFSKPETVTETRERCNSFNFLFVMRTM